MSDPLNVRRIPAATWTTYMHKYISFDEASIHLGLVSKATGQSLNELIVAAEAGWTPIFGGEISCLVSDTSECRLWQVRMFLPEKQTQTMPG